MTLTPDLILRIGKRIARPADRSDDAASRSGAVPLPISEVKQHFEANAPGSSTGLDAIQQKMAEWGFSLDSMNFVDHGGGHISASSDDPSAPLPPPPGEARLDEAEATMRLELPEGVRQLYALADGGFGPGLGLFSLASLVGGYEDICRRGPDWTGEIHWPRHLLPIFNAVPLPSPHGFDLPQIVSIDTVDGGLVTFNEDWDQDGLTPDTAWSDVAPDLATFLERWLAR